MKRTRAQKRETSRIITTTKKVKKKTQNRNGVYLNANTMVKLCANASKIETKSVGLARNKRQIGWKPSEN